MKAISDKENQRNKQVYLQINRALITKNDREIWAEFKQGKPEAFHYIYKTYFSILFNYGCQITQDKELIKDLIQDVFVELNEKKKRLGDVNNIKFYLFKSLKRKILALSKKKFLSKSPDFLNTIKSFAITIPHEEKIISTETEENRKNLLDEAYSKLSVRQREVLMYYFYEDMSYDEISELMDFSKNEHARKLVYRAVCKLKEEIERKKAILLISIPVLVLIILFFCI
ncbi:RNA polymerase sigma factor [Chondrinema litorale]|uniref:RNA polymerase sigma factor n=1 Tax=Chondrinema litorale TaxID=2994555 RepID=UPI0025426E3A|nr:sigma-70 family RNA polymerase sigma factor [Chondrinema litorale]UZR97305.1 sigma-70 family RNA polymerase sigma factor [Chondrinema litorale]